MKRGECLIIFLKAPIKGHVKTRLAKSIGDDHALALYKNFVKDVIGTVQSGKRCLKLFYYPSHSREMLTTWLGSDYELTPQQGASLGERMRNAFVYVFDQGYDKAALIGTDMPDLPHFIPDEAFSRLETADAVIGPAIDGGYYLIGFKAHTFCPAVFEGVPWGSATVFKKTILIFNKSKTKSHHLPMMQDIDDKNDLEAFINRCADNPKAAPYTCSYLFRQSAYFSFITQTPSQSSPGGLAL
ncbi:TIGR04282 family arsenosugar biosynthesis glycosyltransferase [Desulfococcaceae bacterium HSG7]|nr:TIGR04282 family arsenosugar biosynthesis glycosyltransferase [Desulfococcaceae bacterium HSG7]